MRLLKVLKNVTESIPHGLEFPVYLQSVNTNLLLNVLELQVYFDNNKIVYIIIISKVENELFYFYIISPLPKLLGPNQFILVTSGYLRFLIQKVEQSLVEMKINLLI